MTPSIRDITIAREVYGRTRSEPHLIGLVGGVVPGLAGGGSPSGPHQHHAYRWEGNPLLFERGSHTGALPETGDWRERREVWSLDADARLHVAISTRSATEPSTGEAMVYRRRRAGD